MKIDYELGDFFDEMYHADGTPRPHYRKLVETLSTLTEEDFSKRKEAVELAFLQQGITFTVYGNEEKYGKDFPF